MSSTFSAPRWSYSERLSRAISPAARKLMRGVLVVHIKRARNLVPRDKNGFSDPYAVVVVHGMRRFRTDVKYANLNPVWDQFGHYSGTLGSFVKSAMIVKLYDYDRLNFNDPLGVAAIDLTPLLEQSKLSARNVPLTGVDHGTIDVAVHFEQTAVNFAYPTPVAASAFEASFCDEDDIG